MHLGETRTPCADSAFARITVMLGGRPVTHAYHPCESCGFRTIAHAVDTSTDVARLRRDTTGPLYPGQGAECIALVADCPDPANPACECNAHRSLQSGVPDNIRYVARADSPDVAMGGRRTFGVRWRLTVHSDSTPR